MNPLSILRAYPSTTIMGISVIGGATSGWLLGQFTWQQAIAASISGVIAILMKQIVGTAPTPAVPQSSITSDGTAQKLPAWLMPISAAMCILGLSACTADQVGKALAQGQLACAVGPTIVAMTYPTGAAVMAQGAPKAFVDSVCATIQGIAVSPPGAPVPSVTFTPPTFTVPLKGSAT